MQANDMFHKFNLAKEGSRLQDTVFNEREVEDFLNKSSLELTKERIAPWKNRVQLGYGDHEIRQAELAGLVSGTTLIPRSEFILGTELNGDLRGPDLDTADQEEDKFGVYSPIPDEALYILLERAIITKDGIVKDNTRVEPKTFVDYDREISNDHRKPYDNLVWSMDYGSYSKSELAIDSGKFSDSTKDYSESGTNYNMRGVNYEGVEKDINTYRSKYLIPGKGWKIASYRVNYIKIPNEIHIDLYTPSLQVNSNMAPFMHQEIIDKAVMLASAAMIPDPNQYQVNQIESKEDQ